MNLLSLMPQKYLYIGAALVALIGGCSWYSYVKGVEKSAVVIAEYKVQVTDLNNKLEKAKTDVAVKVITKYVTRTVHIKDIGEHNANVAKNIVPSECKLSDGWVRLHNAAATGIEVDPTSAANGADSGIKDTDALATISDNYDTFHQQKAQLDALQQWITETNAAIEAANKATTKKHWWSK